MSHNSVLKQFFTSSPYHHSSYCQQPCSVVVSLYLSCIVLSCWVREGLTDCPQLYLLACNRRSYWRTTFYQINSLECSSNLERLHSKRYFCVCSGTLQILFCIFNTSLNLVKILIAKDSYLTGTKNYCRVRLVLKIVVVVTVFDCRIPLYCCYSQTILFIHCLRTWASNKFDIHFV